MTTTTAEHAPEPADAAPPDAPRRVPPRWFGALAGLLAAGAALAVGELVVGLLEGTRSTVVSVGEVVVDNAPPWLKDFAIRTFGEDDKDALVVGTTIVLVLLAVGLGVAARRRLWVGLAGTALLGVVGGAAALSRPGAGPADLWPAVLGAAAGAGVLWFLLDRRTVPVRTPRAAGPAAGMKPSTMRPSAGPDVPAPPGFDRRAFLVSAAAVGGGVVLAGAGGRELQGRYSVQSARDAVVFPGPASPAAPLPPGVDLGGGITPFVTPNGDFYRVDTALVPPRVTPSDWSLRLGGMVDSPFELSFEELLDRPLIERDITLVCVSNEVGGRYAGTARWLGVPLADLLDEAGVDPGADQLVSRSVDGWTAGTPTALVRDGRDAMVAVGMNGEPLPVEHGFPARLVVPGLYGYTSATKWVTELELTTFDAYDAYWVQRGWARVASIKTLTRIDTPRGLAQIDAGTVPVGGVAWAIHRGIDAVEVRVDGGPWRRAELAAVPGEDTWRQWRFPWEATPGRHTIEARAVDGTGEVQTGERVEPIPDGATGWHQIVVTVR